LSSVGFSELFLLFIIGLLILGPERLPRVASQLGRWVGRARRTANQLRYQLEREIAQAEFEQPPKAKPAHPSQPAADKIGGDLPAKPGASGSAAPPPGSAGDAAPKPAAETAPEPAITAAGETDQAKDSTPG
jgi:sec-independent protein translocase protein TatB